MLRRVAPLITEVSEELSASFIRVTRIGELGTLVTASVVPSSLILVTLIPPNRRFLQEPHGVTSQKTPFYDPFFCLGKEIEAACWSCARC
jgi:hypothetical protein